MEEFTEAAKMDPVRPRTAEELLAQAKALIADDLLTPLQLGLVQNSPYDFLRTIANPAENAGEEGVVHEMVQEVERAVVLGYFQSLLAKASEGEAFSATRLQQALVKGQITAVEALTAALGESDTSVMDKIHIAGVLKS